MISNAWMYLNDHDFYWIGSFYKHQKIHENSLLNSTRSGYKVVYIPHPDYSDIIDIYTLNDAVWH